MVVSDVERPVVIHSNHGTKEANGKKKIQRRGWQNLPQKCIRADLRFIPSFVLAPTRRSTLSVKAYPIVRDETDRPTNRSRNNKGRPNLTHQAHIQNSHSHLISLTLSHCLPHKRAQTQTLSDTYSPSLSLSRFGFIHSISISNSNSLYEWAIELDTGSIRRWRKICFEIDKQKSLFAFCIGDNLVRFF